MRTADVIGLGTAVPPFRVTQTEAATFASRLAGHDQHEARRVAMLYRWAGVKGRHLAVLDRAPQGDESASDVQSLFQEPSIAAPDADHSAPDEPRHGPGTAARMAFYAERAAPLAARAARAALDDAKTPARDITHLVTVSCTGFVAPGIDVALIRELDLCPCVERVHIGFMGCQGALNGLRVARALATTSPSARVLLTTVELCGLHFQHSHDTDLIVADSLFADGAGAVVVCASQDEDERETGLPWRMRASGAGLIPDSLDCLTWNIGDHGFAMTLSPRVPALIEQHLGPWMRTWLTTQHLQIADIQSWAIHPGGLRILSAAEKALELDPVVSRTSRDILSTFGNMSSATVLFVLQRLMAEQAPRPCVALAFGPGLSIEAALFT